MMRDFLASVVIAGLLTALVVVAANAQSISVSKLNGYAVMDRAGTSATKLVSYAVLQSVTGGMILPSPLTHLH